MHLTPREKDKLLVAMAADVARRRRERGVRLNYPEAVALISDYVVEGARDGRSVADLMSAGAEVIGRDDVMDGIAEMATLCAVSSIHRPNPRNLAAAARPRRRSRTKLEVVR